MNASPDLHAARAAATPSPAQLLLLSVATAALLLLSGWAPYDRTTWWLEIAPVLIVWPLLAWSRQRLPLTTLLYLGIFLHACVLMAGGAWSYARVPLGFQLESWLGLHRNPYDKIGHFFQGAVPALAVRELLLRGRHLRPGRMLVFLSWCVCMAVSACYELIEWGAAVALGQGADEFLGTQGDPWDTQSDMAFCGLGAAFSLALLARWQDRQIRRLDPSPWMEDASPIRARACATPPGGTDPDV